MALQGLPDGRQRTDLIDHGRNDLVSSANAVISVPVFKPPESAYVRSAASTSEAGRPPPASYHERLNLSILVWIGSEISVPLKW